MAKPERFSGGRGCRWILDGFRQSIANVAQLPCDVILSVHPGLTDVDGKLKRRRQARGTDALVDPQRSRA